MDFKNSDIANGLDVTSLIGADASASSEGAALLKMALQSGNIMPLTADGQLVLPAGVGLDDIKVVGRDLIIQMPDGTQMIVPDGAITVPQIVVDGVAIPALNFAALLAGQVPQPAAGPPQSSGGNFADNVGDIGDPFALGDLLPPTQLAFPLTEEREVVPGLVDRNPDVIIQDGGPAGRDVIDNVNETGLPGTRANGNVESPGSAAGNGSDSTTGTIFVTAPDGIASITINGVVVTGTAGQQITTPFGVMTLSALNGDQIDYSYRLLDNTSGDTTTDVFLVSLTDADGDVATARLTINIADDVPTARNDIDSLIGGTFGPELGNVLTGADTISGLTGADTLGADGAAISGFRAGASGSFAAVGSNIAGQYGTLTLGANGSYSYVRNVNTPGGVTDVFTYQLTDTDGDASTATLTINIGDAPNRIVFIPDIGDGTIVREPHLPARDSEPSGSQFDGNAETTSGTITFISPDGVGNVTVAGAVLTPGALPQLVSSNTTGSLLITGYTYDPVTGLGSITYVYTLNDNTLNTNGESLSFPVMVTDLDGDVASDSLIIKIVDDAPLAANDSGTQQSENAPVSINLFVNDTPGADGVNLATGLSVVAGSLTGAGALAYGNNGIFTYTPAPGEEGVVTFQYIITDGDGDTSTATVTISLLKDSLPSVEVDGENVVYEGGLPSGSDAASNSETTDGTIAIATGGDALASLVINNVNVTAGGTVTGASGILAISVSEGVYSYSYTLTSNTAGDTTFDDFAVVVTDQDGDATAGTLVIDIIDDVPMVTRSTAPVPTLTVDETVLATNASLSFAGVFTTNFGADGAGTTAYTLGVVAGPSGLVDIATGQAVNLFLNANVVEGRTAGSNAVVFSVSVAANGTVTLDQQRAVSHLPNAGPDQSTTLSAANLITLTATSTDGDGDTATATANIANALVFKDDGSAAIGESGITSEIRKDFNTAFVIDFSGSIDNTELNTQLVAVKAAINALFGSTGGSVSVKFVLFASNAMASTNFTTAAAANTYLDSVNPATGGTRPSGVLGSTTDFSAAMTTLLANYAVDETADNEVFFLSDGNPNENRGSSGQALNDTIRPLWNSFVNNNDINVTAIGVGNGINNSNLQQIDVDGAGAPILVENFNDLIATLVALVTPKPITGDLDVNDDYGTDGGRILSITVPTAAANDPVYTWNGVTGAGSQITASNGDPVINGITSILVATEIGGQFGFNFATGQWSYTPPRNVPADRTEVFNYTIIDGDGDTATASLSVLVENNDSPATAAVTAIMDDDGSTGIVADAAFAKGGALSAISRSADQIRTNNATTSVIAAALLGLAIGENAAAVTDGNLDQLDALGVENPGIGNAVASLAATGGASFVSDLAFELTHDFAQRPHDVASSLRPSEEADVARSFQDAPMAERSALLEDKADPVSDDQSNFSVAFGGGDQVMHSMLDIAAFSASAGAGENAAQPLPIEDALREAMPDLILDRLIDAFTADLGAPANDAGGGVNDSELLAGILSQGVDAFQLAALASNDLSGAHHYDMAMISHS